MTRFSSIAFATFALTGIASAETHTFPDDGGYYTLETVWTVEGLSQIVCETTFFTDTCEVEPGVYREISHPEGVEALVVIAEGVNTGEVPNELPSTPENDPFLPPLELEPGPGVIPAPEPPILTASEESVTELRLVCPVGEEVAGVMCTAVLGDSNFAPTATSWELLEGEPRVGVCATSSATNMTVSVTCHAPD